MYALSAIRRWLSRKDRERHKRLVEQRCQKEILDSLSLLNERLNGLGKKVEDLSDTLDRLERANMSRKEAVDGLSNLTETIKNSYNEDTK